LVLRKYGLIEKGCVLGLGREKAEGERWSEESLAAKGQKI